jgi:hypothetical protein
MLNYYYAQVTDEGVVFVVSDFSKPVDDPQLISIDSYDVSLIGKKWDGEKFVDVLPSDGDGGEQPSGYPVFNVGNVDVVPARKVGDIWWVSNKANFEIKGNIPLPDGEVMVMMERVVDGMQRVDDVRLIATITDGNISIKGRIEGTGNYVLEASRLNRGLERINAPYRLSFETIEFDVYIDTAVA